MQIEKKREFIINVVYMLIILAMTYFIAKYLLGILFPFVLGFLIALSLTPLVKWINKKININNKIISIIVLLLFYGIIGSGLFVLFLKIFTILKNLFESLPAIFQNDIQPLINQFTEWSKEIFYQINPEIIDFIQQFDKNIMDQLASIVKNFSTSSINLLTAMVTKLPRFLIAFFLTIISSFFIAIDFDKIINFLNYQITDKNRYLFSSIKRNGIDVVVNFVKAYGILLSVTFVESAIGLSLMKIDNAIGISIIIAMVDILPVLGTGTILVPWALIQFFNGNISDAIGLAVLYIIITIIRQILEPRVVGDSIGLYPLVTLISMFLGVKIFGPLGLLGLPIVITILVKLHEEGIVEIWRDPNKQKKLKKEHHV